LKTDADKKAAEAQAQAQGQISGSLLPTGSEYGNATPTIGGYTNGPSSSFTSRKSLPMRQWTLLTHLRK